MQRILGALALIVATAATAQAQDAPRGFVRGFGGITFMSETAAVFGGGAGLRLNDHVELIGEVGRMTNVLPHALQRDLDDAARAMGAYFGGPLSIDGKAPSVYAFGGVRLSRVAGSRMRLYVEAGGGTAYGSSDITAFAGPNDVSSQVVRALHIKASETAGLVTVGGGMTIPLTGRLGLDVSYRYMRIFTDDPRISTANMSTGLRWGF